RRCAKPSGQYCPGHCVGQPRWRRAVVGHNRRPEPVVGHIRGAARILSACVAGLAPECAHDCVRRKPLALPEPDRLRVPNIPVAAAPAVGHAKPDQQQLLAIWNGQSRRRCTRTDTALSSAWPVGAAQGGRSLVWRPGSIHRHQPVAVAVPCAFNWQRQRRQREQPGKRRAGGPVPRRGQLEEPAAQLDLAQAKEGVLPVAARQHAVPVPERDRAPVAAGSGPGQRKAVQVLVCQHPLPPVHQAPRRRRQSVLCAQRKVLRELHPSGPGHPARDPGRRQTRHEAPAQALDAPDV
ncbi:hypothetical protein IWW51_004362, partial [Coemansia sp. RSA 2702]